MTASQQHVDPGTPMGANLVGGGATFRVWAPRASAVYVLTGDELISAQAGNGWTPKERDKLVKRDDETWTGFVSGIGEGAPYRFWVVGEGNVGFKRDPYARELGIHPPFPNCDCLVRVPDAYAWHDDGYRTPAFSNLIIYQFHFGVYYAVDAQGQDVREQRRGKFLDLLDRIDYLRELGINAIQPLPIQEYPSEFSLGYNGSDYFSPEMDYQVEDETELQRYLTKANSMLTRLGKPPLTLEILRPGPNQLKLIVDLCHLNGIAVIFDVVYNHAGGGFDDQSLYFFDRWFATSNSNSLYFTDRGWAGGLIFDYSNEHVRQFLIDNAKSLLEEYHIDGLRYDEVSVIDNHGGWYFCQDLTSTLRFIKPQALQNAEYWNDWRWLAVIRPAEGMGFDAALADGLRDRLRNALGQASGGRDAQVNLDGVRDALYRPYGFPAAWNVVQCVENHDVVYADREPRIAKLADPSNARSWYARSRARVAAGLVLTAPGIPMLFMGQEFLEDKNWSDNPEFWKGTLVWWSGLEVDRAMRDHLRFTQDLIRLRRRYPALRGESIHVHHVQNQNRLIAFHRWIEGIGGDVIVVASLNESTYWSYEIGFPAPGRWLEVFNSDYYDHFPNPLVAGNRGEVTADAPPRHEMPCSATIVIPANSLLVFARDS